MYFQEHSIIIQCNGCRRRSVVNCITSKGIGRQFHTRKLAESRARNRGRSDRWNSGKRSVKYHAADVIEMVFNLPMIS